MKPSVSYFQRVSAALKQARAAWKSDPIAHSRPGDWDDEGVGMSEEMRGQGVMKIAGAGMSAGSDLLSVDPEEYLKETFAFTENSMCVPWLMKEVNEGRINIAHAWLFEAKVNGAGQMLKEVAGHKQPYRLRKCFGTESF